MVRGEIPTESGASWISPKCVEAQRLKNRIFDKRSVLEVTFKKCVIAHCSSPVKFILGVKHCFGAGYENSTNPR